MRHRPVQHHDKIWKAIRGFSLSLGMETRILLLTTIVLLSSSPAFALKLTFFGEDLAPLFTPIGPIDHPNSDSARDDFFHYLVGARTENFDSGIYPFQLWVATPFDVDFGSAGVASLLSGDVGSYIDDGFNATGEYAVSPDQFLYAGTNGLELAFSIPVAGFGFYATGFGNNASQASITLARQSGTDTTYVIPCNSFHPERIGSVIYWAIIDTEDPIAGVTFTGDYFNEEFFGFDDLTVADPSQIIPEPATALLLVTGLAGLAAAGRRRSLP